MLPEHSKTLWDLLNSSFVLFLLSSVFLGLLSFGYGQWRDHKNRQQKSEQLNLEIAWRLQAIDAMCSGPDNKRYSNLVNVDKVLNGDPKSSFYVRKPIFTEYQNKSISALLWQLYLVVPSTDRNELKASIRDANLVIDEIRKVRYTITNTPDDDKRPKPRTPKEQEEQLEHDDILTKDYGQEDIFRRVHSLAEQSRWKGSIF
jgi:hypothetical protein